MLDAILRQRTKTNISDFMSHVSYNDTAVGIGTVVCICKGLDSVEAQKASVAFRSNGAEVTPGLLSRDWYPWGIHTSYEIGSLRLTQTVGVRRDDVFCDIWIDGGESVSMEISGESYGAAKCLQARNGILIEETSALVKPLVTRLVVEPGYAECLTAKKGHLDFSPQGTFDWSETGIAYRFVYARAPKRVRLQARFLRAAADLGPLLRLHRAAGNWEAGRRKEWEKFYRRAVPRLSCSDKRIERIYHFNWYVLRANTVHLGGELPYSFVVPSKFHITGWWLFDACYHSMALKWLNDDSLLYGNLLTAAALQTDRGCTHDAAREYGAIAGDGRWYSVARSDASNQSVGGPRLFGIAVWDVYRKTGNLEFLKRMYPHLVLQHRWLSEARRSRLDESLVVATTWCDITWDNSKRWGKGANDVTPGVDWDFPIVPVDTNIYFSMLSKAISDAAGVLGDTETSTRYLEKYRRTREQIQNLLWDEETGYYFDRTDDGRWIRVITPAAFMPLYTGLATQKQFERLRPRLTDPALLWTEFPLATVNTGDSSFLPETGYWRGPTWININCQIVDGLFQYDRELALELLFKTIHLVTHTGDPTSREQYNCQTGHGTGAIDYGWNSIINDVIIKRLLGVEALPDRLRLAPNLRDDIDAIGIDDLAVAGTRISLHYERRPGRGWTARVRNVGRKPLLLTYNGQETSLKPSRTTALNVRS